MTITSPSPYAAAAATTSPTTPTATPPTQTLNQADFLKLLTVQLSQQDPMQPMDDTAFVGQMAQFTALQQSSDIDTQITALNANNSLQTGAGLIGSNVTLKTATGNVSGQVQSVDSSSGSVQINVNGVLYPLNQVIGVAPPPAATSPASSTSTAN